MSSTPSQPEPSAPDGAPDDAAAAVTPGVAETPTTPTTPDVTEASSAATVPGDAPVEPSGATPAAGVEPAAEPRVDIPVDGPLTDAQLAAIAATAQPATVRRAPRYGAFFWTGALVGIVLGVVLGLWLSYDGMVNRWIYVMVTVLGTTLVTVLVAGACAVFVDRRGSARAAAQRAAAVERAERPEGTEG